MSPTKHFCPYCPRQVPCEDLDAHVARMHADKGPGPHEIRVVHEHRKTREDAREETLFDEMRYDPSD